MPLRPDPAVWFNLPGVVAAYQPIAAPGPLLARYNMAHGGDNRYWATDGTPPTWSPPTGWRFVKASSQWLDTGILPVNDQSWSGIGRFAGLAATGTHTLFGIVQSCRFAVTTETGPGSARVYQNGSYEIVAGHVTSGVMGLAGNQGYLNGVVDGGAISSAAGTFSATIAIGQTRESGYEFYMDGYVLAVLIVRRRLSTAEMWHATRQMAYCHVNPDWSAWGRRRRWYYAPEVAAGLTFSPVGSGAVGSNVVRSARQ